MSKVAIKHPYITQDKRICRGSPIISGTRTRVIDIVIEQGLSRVEKNTTFQSRG